MCRFNEPDLGGQANLSPAAAAAAWKQYIQPFAGRAKLVSPAVTNGAAPMGLAWLDSFLAACTGCTIDVIAIQCVHLLNGLRVGGLGLMKWGSIYDAAWNTAYYQNYIGGVVSKYKKPVWVTEVRGGFSTSW